MADSKSLKDANSSSRQASILVVDDSPTVLSVLKTVLTQAGFLVTCLDNGHNACATAKRIKPDLILIDFSMPEVSGFSVCQELGRSPESDSIPIILMITSGDEIGDNFVRDLGIIDYITKPFSPNVLLALIEHTLTKKRLTDPSEAKNSPTQKLAAKRQAENDLQSLATKLAVTLAAKADIPVNEITLKKLEQALSDPKIQELAQAWFSQTPSRYALGGEILVVPIAEVLQLLSLQRQSGFLRINQGLTEISIALKNGKVRLVTATNIANEFLLGNILIRKKLMTPEDLELFLSRGQGVKRKLGTQAVKLGYLEQKDLLSALKIQSSELVYELLRWRRGRFTFEHVDQLPDEVLEFEFDLTTDELLMEGFRRVDEWRLIETVVGDFTAVPARVPGGLDALGVDSLTPEEVSVLKAVDGQKNVQQIVKDTRSSSFNVARILYRLVLSRVLVLPLAKAALESKIG